MNGKRITALFAAVATLGLAGGIAVHARGGAHARVGRSAAQATAAASSDDESAKLLAKGKEIFVEKCAKCHGENGDKALSSGKPLSERGLGTDVIARAVSGRLKDRSDEERRAVTAYIASLMKTKDSEKSEPKQ